jgi:hypothetical protein
MHLPLWWAYVRVSLGDKSNAMMKIRTSAALTCRDADYCMDCEAGESQAIPSPIAMMQ